ncbi:MAG TPA: hypothetical protein VFE96_09980 [Candidatus Bathyarchaeia archaeon]|nr:hypothetical protein [Candidatus Bathyarchaeia archaeon]
MILRPRKSEIAGSLLLSLLVTWVLDLFYNLDPAQNLPLLLAIGATSTVVILYLLQNQRKNEKEFQKHPVMFPNPEGGGILGEYVNRPWRNELAELGQRYPGKKKRTRQKKE